MEKVYRSSKWWEVKAWGESVSELMFVKKNSNNKLYTVLSYWGVFTFCTCCKILICLVCIVVVILCVFAVLCVYCCFFTLYAGLLARSQYSEGPATGHLDTGFSLFPCFYKQRVRRFSTFQVATTCFSRSPPDLNLVVANFIFCLHVK